MRRCNLMRMIVTSTIALVFAGGLSPAHGMEEVAKLTPSDWPELGNGFGRAVAISGDFIVVGAPKDSPPGEQNSGAAYVFHRVNGSWVEQIKLTFSTQGFEDVFGSSVAIEGDWIVVGTPCNMWAGAQPSRVYLYRYDGFAWGEEAELIPSGSFLRDYFGASVSISGDLIAVGAPGGEFDPSQVYVFRRDGATWTEEAVLVGDDTDYDDAFGRAVSANGDLVVVGAYHDDHAGDTSGSAYVFRYDGEGWAQDAKLTAPNPGPGQAFGLSVSIDGTMPIVGRNGGVDLFVYEAVDWVRETELSAPAAGFGRSVAIHDDMVVAGAPFDDHAGTFSGSAYLFKPLGSDWHDIARYVASDATSGQYFGFSVGVSGDTAVVGGGGAAYVFDTTLSIPTVSSWGVIILAFALLLAGSVILHRRRHTSQAPGAPGFETWGTDCECWGTDS